MQRRGAQPQALVAGRRLRGDDDARPPRAARRPRDRRRAARAARAGRQPRRPHPRGAVELHLAGHARAAPQAVPRRAPAAAAGRLHLQGRARPAALRRHVAQHPRPRPLLLHRLRAAHPDGRDGAASPRASSPIVCQTTLEAAGARAAPHRRAQAALQPTLAAPRAGHLGQADPASRSPGCRSCARSRADGARYLGPFRSQRSAEAAVAAVHEVVPLRQCTGKLSARGDRSECALGRDGPVRRALHRGASPSRSTPQSSATPIGLLTGDARAGHRRAAARRMAALSRAGAVRGRRRRPRPAARTSSARPPGPSASPRWRPARDRRRAALGAPAAGSSSASATAGWPVPASAPPAPTRCPTSQPLRATAEVVAAPIHPSPAATPEETEIILRWLEAPGVRIVELDGAWTCPVGGAGGVRMLLDERRPSDVAPFDRDLPVAG